MNKLYVARYNNQYYFPKTMVYQLGYVHQYPKSYVNSFPLEKAHIWKTENGAKNGVARYCQINSNYNNWSTFPIFDPNNWKIEAIDENTIAQQTPDFVDKNHQLHYKLERNRVKAKDKHSTWYCVQCRCRIPKDLFALKISGISALCAICLSDIGTHAKECVEKYDQQYIEKMMADRILVKL